MRKPIALLCASVIILSPCAALAGQGDAAAFRVSRSGDTNLSCGELASEALLMRDIIYTTEGLKDKSKMQEHGITAAGAVGSFLVGTLTAGVGLAAAGFLAAQEVEENAGIADDVQDIAEQRRSFMIGIYNAKDCFGPIEHVMLPPQGQTRLADSQAQKFASIEPASGNAPPPANKNQHTKSHNKKRYNN